MRPNLHVQCVMTTKGVMCKLRLPIITILHFLLFGVFCIPLYHVGSIWVTFCQGWTLILCYSMVCFFSFFLSIASYQMFACSWQPYPLILYLKGFVGRTEHLDKLLKDLIFGTWFSVFSQKFHWRYEYDVFLLVGMASCMFLSERQIYHTF